MFVGGQMVLIIDFSIENECTRLAVGDSMVMGTVFGFAHAMTEDVDFNERF